MHPLLYPLPLGLPAIRAAYRQANLPQGAPVIHATLDTLTVPIDSVKPHPRNPRRGNVEAIIESLARNGQYRPIVVNRRDCCILGGNHTWQAAKALGWEHIAATWVDVDEETAARILVVDNRTNDLAGWDDEGLLAVLEELVDLEGTGYDERALAELAAQIEHLKLPEGAPDPDEVPALPAEPITKAGDLWLLGEHRLLCGDATVIGDVERLMAEEQAVLIFTDPPYNVDYEGGTGLTIQNDAWKDSADFRAFLQEAFTNMYVTARPGAPIYVCHADREGLAFREAFTAAGFYHAQTLVWAKQALVLGRQDFHSRHELILYGWKRGTAHSFYGRRNQNTVWEEGGLVTATPVADGYELHIGGPLEAIVVKVPRFEIICREGDELTTVWRVNRPVRSAEHPTTKPVELICRALKLSSRRGDVVQDLFGGSGSTLVAAEMEGRRAHLMELDPAYCDVICRRYERFSGSRPRLEAGGHEVSFLKAA